MTENGLTRDEIRVVLDLWSIPNKIHHWEYVESWENDDLYGKALMACKFEDIDFQVQLPSHPDSGPLHPNEGVRLVADLGTRQSPASIVDEWNRRQMQVPVAVHHCSLWDDINGEVEGTVSLPRLTLDIKFTDSNSAELLQEGLALFLTELYFFQSFKRPLFFSGVNWSSTYRENVDRDELIAYLNENERVDTESLCQITSTRSKNIYSVIYELFSSPQVFERVDCTPSQWRLRG